MFNSKNIAKIFLTSMFVLFSINSPSFAKKELVSSDGLNKGEKIPSFDLESESHKMLKFNENFRGKVLLLVVSNYCTKDLSGAWSIGTFYKFHKNKNFAYPTIFSRRCVPFYVPNAFVYQSAKSTADQTKVPYFLMDLDEEVSIKFKASKEEPHIYVVDKKGIVRYKMILKTPFVSKDEMEETISKLLNE